MPKRVKNHESIDLKKLPHKAKEFQGIDLSKIAAKKETSTMLLLRALLQLFKAKEPNKEFIPEKKAEYKRIDPITGKRLLPKPSIPAHYEIKENKPDFAELSVPKEYTILDKLFNSYVTIPPIKTSPNGNGEKDVPESNAARNLRLGVRNLLPDRYPEVAGIAGLFDDYKPKKKGGDVVSGISDLLGKVGLELPELHMPGHNFTGPGTDLKRRLDKNDKPRKWSKPINRVDETALHHDLCYRDNPDRTACDKKMLSELDNIPNPTLRERAERVLVKGVIGTKAKLGIGKEKCKCTGKGKCHCGGNEIDKKNIQTVLVHRCNRTLKDAEKWIEDHGFKNKKVDETRNYYRFRQYDPKHFKHFKTIDVGDKVLIVVGERI